MCQGKAAIHAALRCLGRANLPHNPAEMHVAKAGGLWLLGPTQGSGARSRRETREPGAAAGRPRPGGERFMARAARLIAALMFTALSAVPAFAQDDAQGRPDGLFPWQMDFQDAGDAGDGAYPAGSAGTPSSSWRRSCSSSWRSSPGASSATTSAPIPTPSRVTHNTTVEVLWTVLPVLILVAIAMPSFRLLYGAVRPLEALRGFRSGDDAVPDAEGDRRPVGTGTSSTAPTRTAPPSASSSRSRSTCCRSRTTTSMPARASSATSRSTIRSSCR